MRTTLTILAASAACLIIGAALGTAYTLRHHHPPDEGAALTMQTAGKLTIILKAADLVHGGDTNQALRVLVGEVDYGLAELGLAQERAQLDSNAERSLRFCLAYRATNSWIEAFEDPQSATVQRARMLVKKSQ